MVVIPQANKALFPDAPMIANPAGEVNSVVAAGVIRAAIENTKAHNTQIDKNLGVLQDEQNTALERQNTANLTAWQNCNGAPEIQPQKKGSKWNPFD